MRYQILEASIDWLFDHAIDGGMDDLFAAELLNSDNKHVENYQNAITQ